MRSVDLIKLLRQPGSALLCGKRTWTDDADAIAFGRPEAIILAHDAGEVPAVLDSAEHWQANGHWVVGYAGYEAGAAFGLPNHPPRADLPLAWFACYPPSAVSYPDVDALRPEGATSELEAISEAEVALDVSEREYIDAIARIKELIASGDTYQVNYTCRASFEAQVDPVAYFLAMTRSHPVPYGAFLNLGEAQVLSMSPELFLRRRGDLLVSKPMKGTRKRGRTSEEDRALAQDLVTATKDRAENLMIVDMVRNDLGRVSRIGGVTVPALFEAEKYRTVWQMTTSVTGELRATKTLGDIFAATFPGASITGAPKHRTMEIIRELEPDPRGVYCGALGVLMPAQQGRTADFTFNLPIRTLIHCEGQFLLGIGAGIVWDSDPRSEYEETLLKSHFAFRLEPDLRLFETLLLDADGEFAYRDAHMARLRRSADYFDFPCDLDEARVHLDRFATATQAPAVVRLELDEDGAFSLHVRPVPAPVEGPLTVALSRRRTCPEDRLLLHKTTRRALYDEERERLADTDCDEVIFANTGGNVTEGAITNLFLRFSERWVTPPVTDGLLPGTWREHYLREIGAEERSITLDQLALADEVIIGNSVRGPMQVAAIIDAGDGEVIYERTPA